MKNTFDEQLSAVESSAEDVFDAFGYHEADQEKIEEFWKSMTALRKKIFESNITPAAGPWQKGEPPKIDKKWILAKTFYGFVAIRWNDVWEDENGYIFWEEIEQWAEINPPE
jgi:hypothetical protein